MIGKYMKVAGRLFHNMKQILYIIRYMIIYKKTRKEISRLYSENNAVSKSLSNVFNAILEKRISMEERVWIEKIESLRNELNASSTKITIADYGAVSPDLNLKAEEMYRGRVVTKTIGEVSLASKSSM